MSCRDCQLGQGMNDCDECEIQLQRIALERIATALETIAKSNTPPKSKEAKVKVCPICEKEISKHSQKEFSECQEKITAEFSGVEVNE